jgi:RNA polymerase sigma factor (sigma-70 family)
VAPRNEPDPDKTPGSVELAYRQYRSELQRYFAVRARDSASAEDLVQETYERIVRYRPVLPIGDEGGAYLFGVARNVLRDANKKELAERQHCMSYAPAAIDNHAQESSNLWIHEEGGESIAREEFERVLNQLPHEHRVAFIRHRLDGRSYQEIADELGVCVSTVTNYIRIAMTHLARHFSLHRRSVKP